MFSDKEKRVVESTRWHPNHLNLRPVWGKVLEGMFKNLSPNRTQVNPRPGEGGAIFCPLHTSRYIFRTPAPIVTKLSVSSRSSILHIVTKNFSKGYDTLPANDVRVTSCSAVFGPKKGFAGRAVGPALKIQKNAQDIKGVELLGLQN